MPVVRIEDGSNADEEGAPSGQRGTAVASTTDSGKVTVVDAKEHIESEVEPADAIGLDHVAKIFTVSGRYSEVNQEQIDRVRMSKREYFCSSLKLLHLIFT